MPSTPARSNAGGAVRGKARAAQVQAMHAARLPKGARNKTSAAANVLKRSRGTMDRGRRQRAAMGGPMPKSSAPSPAPAERSAGFNPFGVPASTILDAIINSQRKKR